MHSTSGMGIMHECTLTANCEHCGMSVRNLYNAVNELIVERLVYSAFTALECRSCYNILNQV